MPPDRSLGLAAIPREHPLRRPGSLFAPGGAAEALIAARKAGQTRFIGFTGHKHPHIHLYMLELARKNNFQFDTVQMPVNVMDQSDSGESEKVDSVDVNEYLREITQEDFTAKDFRTWHGTGHMAQQLAALGPASSETATKRNIVQAITETAKHLGNRPAACRKYYVHPAALEGYVEQTIFAVMPKPTAATVARTGKLGPLEKAIIRIVKSYVGAKRAKASISFQ